MAISDLWRKVVERVLSRVDRVTHTRDRARARLRAARRGRPRRVVVTCYGNICRSPYAAAYLKHRLAQHGIDDVEVDSAGLYGPGRPAHEQAAAVARSRGVSLDDHRSRLFRQAEVAEAELVLVMTRHHRELFLRQFGVPAGRVELLGDFDVADPPYREITDPYGRPEAEFIRVFDQIERSIDGLSAAWTAGPAPLSRLPNLR